MATIRRLFKPLCLTGALAASALSLGALLPKAKADEADKYPTGLPHITIEAANDSASPLLYPDRFTALQIFEGKIPDDEGNPADTLTAITWGSSINPEAFIKGLVESTWGVGTLNAEALAANEDSVDLPKASDYEATFGADTNVTLGNLFARWAVDNIRDANSAFNSSSASGSLDKLEDVKEVLNSQNVSPLSVATFLQQFAMTDEGGDTPYSSPSMFTSSEVAAGFAFEASKATVTNVDGLEQGVSKWRSYALKSGASGDASNLAKSLVTDKLESEDVTSTTWVIDDVDSPGTDAANVKGLPTGYYIVLDRLNDRSDATEGKMDYSENAHSAISELILRVVDSDGVNLRVKSDVPTVDKKIQGVDTDDGHDANVVRTSDEVTYILTASLPENVDSYHANGDPNKHEYSITYHDKLPALFNIDSDTLKIYVNENGNETSEDVSDEAWKTPTGRDISSAGKTNKALNDYRDNLGEAGSSAKEVDLDASGSIRIANDNSRDDDCSIHIVIPNVYALKDTDGENIAINKDTLIYAVYTGYIKDGYDAMNYPLLEEAVGSTSATDQLKNTVFLEYTNNPYFDGTGPHDGPGTGFTPEDSVQHYTFGMDLVKFENDFAGDNPRLQGAGFSFIQAAPGDNNLTTPANIDSSDPDNLKDRDVQVARFRKYTHKGSKKADPLDIYDANQDVYVFAGWAKPVLADEDYVTWYKANAKNPTSHIHEGMLVAELNSKEEGIHTKGVTDEKPAYYQVLFTNDNGKIATVGLGEDAFTIIESLVPEAHKALEPFSWRFTMPDPTESTVGFTAYTNGDAAGVALPESAPSTSQGTDARMYSAPRTFEGSPYTSPYKGTIGTTLELRNVTNIDLPTTGGIGTTMLYIAGAVLVLGGATYIIYRKRQEGYDEI